MILRCCFVSEVIGINRTFPPSCFSFAEDGVGVDLVGGDVSLSPPPPLAKEKLDFDGEVYDTDDGAFGVDAAASAAFFSCMIALLSLLSPTKKYWHREIGDN